MWERPHSPERAQGVVTGSEPQDSAMNKGNNDDYEDYGGSCPQQQEQRWIHFSLHSNRLFNLPHANSVPISWDLLRTPTQRQATAKIILSYRTSRRRRCN